MIDGPTLLQQFRAKFRVAELLVYSNSSWSWSVRPSQPTLGAGIISLNRYALHFSEATPEEMIDLGDIVKAVERALTNNFQVAVMNYLMLMMVDNHVHFHAIPRFDGTRSFEGLDWPDKGWPGPPALSEAQHSDKEAILVSLRDCLRESVG